MSVGVGDGDGAVELGVTADGLGDGSLGLEVGTAAEGASVALPLGTAHAATNETTRSVTSDR